MQSQQKPRLNYGEVFVRKAAVNPFNVGTVAWIAERYIREMNGTDTGRPVRTLGISNVYTLRVIQRDPIGAKEASKLTKHDIIDLAKRLGKTGRRGQRKPATVNQFMGYLNVVLKYAPSGWDDCDGVSNKPVTLAQPFLRKHGYIGASTPRKRVPTNEEIERLLVHLAIPPKRKFKNVISAMPDIVAFALVSSRRLGEICRMMYGDIEWDKKDDQGRLTPMYMVRDLKHPKLKKGNNKRFPLFAELAEIITRQPRKNPNDPLERVFPFESRSVGQKYALAKKVLGIEDLRFHDNRREAITRWLKKLPPHKVKLISGHETTRILEKTYDAQKPEGLHQELAEMLTPLEKQPYNHVPGWRSDMRGD